MEKAILIGVQTYTSHSFEERMEEMKELALACDIEICMSISQNLEHPHKKYYMNPGKIEEVKRILEDKECSMVLVLEAMKMENEICAAQDGVIASVEVAVGDMVEGGDVLATMN